MEKLVSYLNNNKLFVLASKQIIKYTRCYNHKDTKPKTYYIHQGDSIPITTSIGNTKETKNICHHGDFLITGPFGEKYVVKSSNIPNLFNLIDGILYTRPQPRQVAKITKTMFKKLEITIPLRFITSWGEEMVLYPDDYLVKDGDYYYRIEASIFKRTYLIVS
jgi:hypothetical protein